MRSAGELTGLVAAAGSALQELNGIGPSGAARLIGDIGDVSRFATRGHFASWNGTAPLDASSGDQKRHRQSRAGNRRINRVLHIMAIVQLRHDTEGRAYYRRKLAAGKTPMEAMRCLKRRLSDVVYKQMIKDPRQRGRVREDTRGRLFNPARSTRSPWSTLRNSHFPDPPRPRIELSSRRCLDGMKERGLAPRGSRAGCSGCSRLTTKEAPHAGRVRRPADRGY